MRLGTAGRGIIALVVALSQGGCAAGYVLRAACEEAKILWRRQPIEELLATDLDADTRAKLETVLQARTYAQETLGLSVGGSFATLVTVDADQVVHVVSAAPRDRLEAYTWWFPIVGRVPYRGYFAEEDARALAEHLERQGYDTYVRPAVAFSTLGWFDDPLLSNLLRANRVHLVETILHELLHSTLYVAGGAAFNESLASFVGWRGAAAFFASGGDQEASREAERRWQDSLTFSRFLAGGLTRLEAAYENGITPEERGELFRSLQTELGQHDFLTDAYLGFSRGTLNNAVLLNYRMYSDQLDLFERAYAQRGHDLPATIAWLRATTAGRSDPFAAIADALGESGSASAVSSTG